MKELSKESSADSSKESSADSSRKACGLLSLMDKFSSFIGLKIVHFFFAVTEQVSLTLQGKDVSSQEISCNGQMFLHSPQIKRIIFNAL